MKKYQIVLIHFTIWLFYIGLNVIDYIQKYSLKSSEYKFATIKQYTFYLIYVLLFYFNAYYLYPKFFSKKKFQKYIILLLSSWLFCNLLYLVHGYFLYLISGEYSYFTERFEFYLAIYFYFIYFTGLSIGLRLLTDWFKNQSLQEELSQAKLKLLTFQISPHFLFNTLNNIYLLVKRKSDKAPNAVLMLSDLLRNTLIENLDEKVPIENEVSYLTNFIELQKLRLEFPEIIIIKMEFDSKNYCIYPFLLIPFIENAFKHGDLNRKDSILKINLKIINGILDLIVENQYKDKFKDSTSGIGINNVKNRLEHYYKNEYSLIVNDDKINYHVKLEIKL